MAIASRRDSGMTGAFRHKQWTLVMYAIWGYRWQGWSYSMQETECNSMAAEFGKTKDSCQQNIWMGATHSTDFKLQSLLLSHQRFAQLIRIIRITRCELRFNMAAKSKAGKMGKSDEPEIGKTWEQEELWRGWRSLKIPSRHMRRLKK